MTIDPTPTVCQHCGNAIGQKIREITGHKCPLCAGNGFLLDEEGASTDVVCTLCWGSGVDGGNEGWAESSWGDDRDFQCGLNPEGVHEPTEQIWRIEVRFDFTGTEAEAQEAAGKAANTLDVAGFDNPEVTDIADENWNSI